MKDGKVFPSGDLLHSIMFGDTRGGTSPPVLKEKKKKFWSCLQRDTDVNRQRGSLHHRGLDIGNSKSTCDGSIISREKENEGKCMKVNIGNAGRGCTENCDLGTPEIRMGNECKVGNSNECECKLDPNSPEMNKSRKNAKKYKHKHLANASESDASTESPNEKESRTIKCLKKQFACPTEATMAEKSAGGNTAIRREVNYSLGSGKSEHSTSISSSVQNSNPNVQQRVTKKCSAKAVVLPTPRKPSLTCCNNNNLYADTSTAEALTNQANVKQLTVQTNSKNQWQRSVRQSKVTANKSSGRDSTKSNTPLWDSLQKEPPYTQLYLLLAAACCLVYVNGLKGEYVHDDVSAVLRNPDVQGTRAWWKVFLNDFWGRALTDPQSHKSYRPLTILTFRWSHWIWGNVPLADHALNLLLHTGVTMMYAHTLLSALHLTYAHALISGLIFATHPVHTEAVTGVVGRADLLAAIVFLISFHAYHRSIQAKSSHSEWAWTWLAGLLACVGVLCKENAISVLGVCVMWDTAHWSPAIKRYLQGRTSTCDFTPLTRRTGRMICLGIVAVFLRVMLMRGSPVFSDQDNPAAYNNNTLTRLQTFWYLPAHNVWLLLFPNLLSYDWQMGSIPMVTSLYDIRNFGSIILYVTLLLLMVSALRSKGGEGLAIVWSLLMLCLPYIPASNVFFTVGFVVAERLLYIPSLGWCTLVSLGAVRLSRHLSGKSAWRLLLVLLFIFSLKTIRRNWDWRSREALFRSGVRALPHNAKMHYNYANLMRDSEDVNAAVFHYREAIRLWWSYPSAHNNLGTVLQQQGHTQMAEKHFSMALQTHKKHPHAALNLARLWRQQGRTPQAIGLLAPIFSPEEEEVGGNIGRLLAELFLQEGRHKEAEDVYLSLAAAQPNNPNVLVEYGLFLQKLGRTEAATRHFEAALSLEPSHTAALTNYAALSQARHQHAHAYQLYTRALEGTWEAETATALARVCLLTDRLNQAEELLNNVILHHHPHLPAMVYLAQVRLQQKQYRASEDILKEVLKESPKYREALYQLSLLYSASNRSEEAVDAAMEAARACIDPKDVCALLHAHHADLLHTFTLMDAAISSYQLAVSLEPALTRAHLNLGAIYHIQGRYSLAWEHYTTALSHDPTNALLLENMEKLRRVSKTFTRR